MECNRDEAVRARDIAELKYAKHDFTGAKKFLLKAQQLFPTLEGLTQMLSVMEVHAVAQVKVGGIEMDWYGILQVEPGADDIAVKKQYRKLALLLHPDKNKSVGAEAAFKLIGEAWGILSDKSKRAVHDVRRGIKIKATHARVVMDPNVQSFHPAPAPPPQSSGAFWTACPSCKMQYQYLRTYENYQLQCPKCKEVFVARDIHNTSTTGNGAAAFNWAFESQRHDFGFDKVPASAFNGSATANGFMNGGPGSFASSFPNQATSAAFFSSAATAAAAQSKVAAAAVAAAAAAAAAATSAVPANNLAADVVKQTYQQVKRERVEAEKESRRKEKEMRKKEKEDQRKEKEELRKARETERSREAMDRLMAKRKEHVTRDESKRKVDVRPGRKLKRKKRNSEGEEEEEELEDEDPKVVEHGLQDDLSSPPQPRRRSSRAKKNIATYKVDVSDDSDLEDFPAIKRTKAEGEADGTEKSGEEDLRGPGRREAHIENGGKGKSLADDSNHEKRGSGTNGGEEFDRERVRRSMNEIYKDEQGGAAKRDSYNSDYIENSRRCEGVSWESKVCENPRDSHKTKPGKSSQHGESPLTEKEIDNGEKSWKSEDFGDEKSPSKSPRTLRMRVKSPKVQAPFNSPSVDKDDILKTQHQVSSPTPSAGSTFSSEKEEDDTEEAEEQIQVPDPDIHDFDSARTEKDILTGQIWAIYDNQDGMPRFYGRISRVSLRPFKVHMCWLELCSSEEEKFWTENFGLSITCGEFKVGKSTVMDQINTFSHVVADRAGKGMIKIYPKKNQVWAIYRDWDPDQLGPETVPRHGGGLTYRYDMVDIISDFSEEKGVRIAKLVKLRNFTTLFSRQSGPDAIRVFKPVDLLRFSHSVPVQRMEAHETDLVGVPRGSVELDPASTPMDLIFNPSEQPR